MNELLSSGVFQSVGIVSIVVVILIVFGIAIIFNSFYKKISQGKVIVRNGFGGTKISFSGMVILPIFHNHEIMDVSVKRVEIDRRGKDGLICKDNLRADIKVAFFVRVNQTREDVLKVAQALGCAKASDPETLMEFFDAKFSEALKTVGKQFDFEQLYGERENFKQQILQIIGTDLNGYVLDDAAIDYLEQTSISDLDANNILDSQGIKKIKERTSIEKIKANEIQKHEEETISKKNLETKEKILEMQRQETEAEEKQKREIAIIKSNENAEAAKAEEERRLEVEKTRLATEQEIGVLEQAKEREVSIAQKQKEREEELENVRTQRAIELEKNEREKIVALADYEKQRVLEEEQKNIQEVVRERVIIERATVEEEEKKKDVQELAEANRAKEVTIIDAEKTAQEAMVTQTLQAETNLKKAEFKSKQDLIEADANIKKSEKDAEAIKVMAAARVEDKAADGIAEARIIEVKAAAKEKDGTAAANILKTTAEAQAESIKIKGSSEADIIALKAKAEAEAVKAELLARADGEEAQAKAITAKGTAEAEAVKAGLLAKADGEKAQVLAAAEGNMATAKANEELAKAEANGKLAMVEATEKSGKVEADVIKAHGLAEAENIELKAEAMKKYDGMAREHDQFILRLEKDTEIKLKDIDVQKDIAVAQAKVVEAGLRSANIDIVGGENQFFDKIVGSIGKAKSIDRLVNGSEVLTDIKETFFKDKDPEKFRAKLREFINISGMNTEDIKNLSVSSFLSKVAKDPQADKGNIVTNIGNLAKKFNLSDTLLCELL